MQSVEVVRRAAGAIMERFFLKNFDIRVFLETGALMSVKEVFRHGGFFLPYLARGV